MRLLVVDAGNSRIKWGVHEHGAWAVRDHLPTAAADSLSEAIAGAMPVERAVVTNVAGGTVASRIAATLESCATVRWVAGCAEQCGVRSGYANPAQLGPDRWAALIGARHLFNEPCVVVNAGTTMTVDVLSHEGIFIGGCIVPGYALMRSSLARDTAQLALQDGEFAYFPDSTGDAIASGALNALAGAVERMRSYMLQTGQDEPLIVLSGGDAPLLQPLLSARVELVDNLVLEGLAVIGMDDV
jgi:type III pantothenate kinase